MTRKEWLLTHDDERKIIIEYEPKPEPKVKKESNKGIWHAFISTFLSGPSSIYKTLPPLLDHGREELLKARDSDHQIIKDKYAVIHSVMMQCITDVDKIVDVEPEYFTFYSVKESVDWNLEDVDLMVQEEYLKLVPSESFALPNAAILKMELENGYIHFKTPIFITEVAK